MKITSALLLHNGVEFLAIHPTHSPRWDIPKGEVDVGEEYIDTCVREVKEETGLDIPRDKIRYLGKYEYRKETKDMVLFEYKVNILPDISKMKCVSYFERYGKTLMEVDDYMYIRFDDTTGRIWDALQKVFNKIESKLKLNK